MLSLDEMCSGCGRPRSEGRPNCIYCGENFVAPVEQREAMFDDLLPPRARDQPGHTVVLRPDAGQELLDSGLVSALLGVTEFHARQLVRRSEAVHLLFDAARAERIVRAAKHAGIPVISYAQRRLDDLAAAARVVRLELPAKAPSNQVGYRHEHEPDTLRVVTTRRELRLRISEIALVVAGRIDIELERQTSSANLFKSNGDDPLERVSTRPRVRDYDGRLVFDLWTVDGRAFRLLELQSTVHGDGFVEARRGASFGRLRRWIESRAPKVEFVDGFARHAVPRRRRLDRVAAGIPWSPTARAGVIAQAVRDTGASWDAWSASAYMRWQIESAPER